MEAATSATGFLLTVLARASGLFKARPPSACLSGITLMTGGSAVRVKGLRGCSSLASTRKLHFPCEPQARGGKDGAKKTIAGSDQ